MNQADFVKLFAYTRWANARVIGVSADLVSLELHQEIASSFSSIFKTLEHMFFAEWVWLKRLNGISPARRFDGHEFRNLAELCQWWEINDLEWQAFVEAMADADAAREITYRNLQGEEFTVSQENIMHHVANHATYHRGQIVTMLRRLGKEGVTTDMIFFTG
jgi:uncharacterized damage-inducible protein DinB